MVLFMVNKMKFVMENRTTWSKYELVICVINIITDLDGAFKSDNQKILKLRVPIGIVTKQYDQ